MWDTILGAAGLVGNIFNAQTKQQNDMKIAEMNIANQKEFAQHGVRWKVADAEAAGLHPLAALGAQTNSFSNVVGGSGDTNDYAAMGQNLGRSIDAGSTSGERQDRMGAAIARTAQVFSLEKMNLENEQLKSQIALTRSQLPPPFPTQAAELPPGALGHLSRSPERTSSGNVVDSKQSEQELEAPQPVKNLRWYGVPLETPSWHSSGQTFDDVLGDDLSAKIFNIPPLVLHNLYKLGQWGESKNKKTGKMPPKMFPYIY